jgi:IS5 family transposase
MSQRRTSHYAAIAQIAYELTQAVLPAYSHRNSPHRYTQPQVAAAVLVGFYLDLSYRDMEEFLHSSEQVSQALGLGDDLPDHSTLYRMYRRLGQAQLRALNAALLTAMGIEEEGIAVDATGFSLTQASEHYLSRQGKVRNAYLKGFYAVGIASQLILGWLAGWGPGSDMRYLNPLRRQAHPYGQQTASGRALWWLLGDKGFDGEQARPTDLIPPRQGKQQIVRSDRLLRRARTDQARLDGLYGQRWKVETVHSAMKRKSGAAIRSRKPSLQFREVGMKALVYNLHR